MEPPIDFTADSVRNEKVKVLKSLHTPGPKHVVRGQYGPGFVEGEEVRGYREEEGVAPSSMTDTFVAAKLFVDNWRWADTPFYVRMGKRLARRETTIAIQFKRAPHPPFEDGAAEGLRPNVLLIHVQPNEGVSLAIGAKVPGQGMTIRTVHMDFLYGGAFREGLPDAYERLILDAMLGDATLFTRVGRDRGAVGARRRDRRALAARPPVVPELRRRDVGAGARPTSSCTGTADRGAGTERRTEDDWTGEDVDDRRRSSASSRGCATRRRRGRAAEPAHVGDDAHRLGAAGVADGGGGDARRHGGAAPVAHAAARAAARRARRARCADLAPLLPDRRPGDLRRGDRARRCAASARRRPRRSCCRS